MTSKRAMRIQVVHSDRDALDSMITHLVSERLPLGGADVDLLGEDLEVPGVVSQQRHPVNVGGRGDR
jgi:hypothetical protein